MLDAFAEQHLHADADAQRRLVLLGSLRRAAAVADTASSPAITAANAPTPGTTKPSAATAAAGSAVSSTSAPARSNARTAERTLPDP